MRHDECMVNSFILVRHAETPYSAQGRMNPDSTVEVGLTAPGERAARGLGRELASEQIDALVVAPSLRTRLTAAALVADRHVSTHVVDQLAEIVVGPFEDGPVSAYTTWLRDNPLTAAPPGGESALDATTRFLAGWRRVLRLPGPVVLVVSHNLPLRMLLNAAAGEDPLTGPLQRIPNVTRHDLTRDQVETGVAALRHWRDELAPTQG
ncbi:MAG: histidine phosphatase family protein [Gaiellales bacterium]